MSALCLLCQTVPLLEFQSCIMQGRLTCGGGLGALAVTSMERLCLIFFRKLVRSYSEASGEQLGWGLGSLFQETPEGNGRIVSGSMNDTSAACVGSPNRHSGTVQGPWIGLGFCEKQGDSVLSESISFLTANPRKLMLCEIQYFSPSDPTWEHGASGQAGQRMAEGG